MTGMPALQQAMLSEDQLKALFAEILDADPGATVRWKTGGADVPLQHIRHAMPTEPCQVRYRFAERAWVDTLIPEKGGMTRMIRCELGDESEPPFARRPHTRS